MSELKDNLMKEIEEDKLKMRPRSFFVFTKAAVEISLIALFVSAIFLINLSVYLPKRGLGPMHGQPFRLNMLLNVVPWHYLIFGAIGLGLSFWLLYRFTGTYKKHFLAVVAIISILALLLGTMLAFSNFNQRLERGPGFRNLYMMDDAGFGMGPGPRYLK